MSDGPRGFLFMPAFPSEKIWVAPFHTAGVENADSYLLVDPVRFDEPLRGHISQPGDRIPQDHMLQQLLQLQIITGNCSEAKKIRNKSI